MFRLRNKNVNFNYAFYSEGMGLGGPAEPALSHVSAPKHKTVLCIQVLFKPVRTLLPRPCTFVVVYQCVFVTSGDLSIYVRFNFSDISLLFQQHNSQHELSTKF